MLTTNTILTKILAATLLIAAVASEAEARSPLFVSGITR